MADLSVPFYVKSRTPDQLMLEMQRNNKRVGMYLKYFDIQFAKDHWYAWYYLDRKQAIKIKMNETFKGRRPEANVD